MSKQNGNLSYKLSEVYWFDSNSLLNKSYMEGFFSRLDNLFKGRGDIGKVRGDILNKAGAGGKTLMFICNDGSAYGLFVLEGLGVSGNKVKAYESIIYTNGAELRKVIDLVEKVVAKQYGKVTDVEVDLLCDVKRRNWRLRKVQSKEKAELQRKVEILNRRSIEVKDFFKFAKEVGTFAKIKRDNIKYNVPLDEYLHDWYSLCRLGGATVDILTYRYNSKCENERVLVIKDKSGADLERWFTEGEQSDVINKL